MMKPSTYIFIIFKALETVSAHATVWDVFPELSLPRTSTAAAAPLVPQPEESDDISVWEMFIGSPSAFFPAGKLYFYNNENGDIQEKRPRAVASRRDYRRNYFGASLVFDDDHVQVYLGNVHDALDLFWLQTNRIGAVLNMMKMDDWYFSYVDTQFRQWFTDSDLLRLPQKELEKWYGDNGVLKYLNIPIVDAPDVDLVAILPRALAFIDEARARHLNILVHCHAGQNRSAAVVVAWLISQNTSLNLQDVISRIDKERSARLGWHILQNEGFNAALIRYCLELRRNQLGSESDFKDQCRLPDGPWIAK